ncbi:WD40-repeat-containing domain protein [Peziza echinospora]|nr:WD40-repeat-containing domain protein [Peziza echinospora]
MTSLETSPVRNAISTLFLDQPPACVLVAPTDPSLVIIGTYLYEPELEVPRKSGCLQLYRWEHSDDSLTLLSSHPTNAILDVKFSKNDPTYIATGQSGGLYQPFRLITTTSSSSSTSTPRLTPNPHNTSPILDPSRLLLSLSWHPTDPHLLACTTDDGRVVLFHDTQTPDGNPNTTSDERDTNVVVNEYKPHDAEAWTCEFSPDGTILYSGGDDSVLNAQDLVTEQSIWRDRKTHGAGVTAIMARPDNNTLITGSYDDHLRVFDLRTRKVVAEANLGGGVWRLADRGGQSLVASCMYAGTRIVDLGPNGTSPQIVARFEEHESMNYGCGIHPGYPDTVVSCSFYDKRLCIWNI